MRHVALGELLGLPPKSGGLRTKVARNTADIRAFFDSCAACDMLGCHGDPRRLLASHLELIRQHAKLKPSDVVLDIGCGTGHHLRALALEIRRGIGIDLSPGMIDVARADQTQPALQGRLSFQVGNAAERADIPDGSIDLAICIGALEHMLDKVAVAANVYKVLRAGGRFFCLSPDADYIWYRRIAPMLGLATKHLSTDRFLGRKEYEELFQQAGFRQIDVRPWTFIPGGDVAVPIRLLLAGLAKACRCLPTAPLQGGLCVCAWKGVEDENASR